MISSRRSFLCKQKNHRLDPHRMEGCPTDGFILSLCTVLGNAFSAGYIEPTASICFQCVIVFASNVFVYTQLPLVRVTPETPHCPSFDLLLQCVKLGRIKELTERDPQAVTYHLDGNELGVLALPVQYILDA